MKRGGCHLRFRRPLQCDDKVEGFLVTLAAVVEATVEAGEFSSELTVLTAFYKRDAKKTLPFLP